MKKIQKLFVSALEEAKGEQIKSTNEKNPISIEEAQKIFREWQNYQEIADKMGTIFITVPESFLPYPADLLEEALNIIAKSYYDSGDKEASKNIQESVGRHLTGYYYHFDNSSNKNVVTDTLASDEEVIRNMRRELDFMLNNPELLKTKLDSLKRSQNSWAVFKERNNN